MSIKMAAATRTRMEAWLEDELADPPAMGEGRNNFIIRLAPRMIELGWTKTEIFESFEEAFGDGAEGKDEEIWAAITNAEKYVQAEVPLLSLKEQAEAKAALQQQHNAAKRNLEKVLRDYHWPKADILSAGGVDGWNSKEQTIGFISGMFSPEDVVWLGNKYHSGKGEYKKGRKKGQTYDNSNHFKTTEEWLGKLPRAWEFVSHCTFLPGTFSRDNKSVAVRKYMVVESDSLPIDDIGAVFAYLNHNGATLRAVVHSGNKSLHGWFDWQSDNDVGAISAMLEGLKCDPSTLRASQPVRLPGIVRQDTDKIQKLLYFNPSIQ